MILECGCDEVGRGAGAAEVYVGACILDPRHPIAGLRDSKKLTARQRELLAAEIRRYALSWFIATASVEEVEIMNVLQATLLAMKRAVAGLSIQPAKVWIDGNQAPELAIPLETVIGGDDLIPAISAASIIAKVARDQRMIEYHKVYPEYGFDCHKGYLTKQHLDALRQFGPCPIHRKTYKPIRDLLPLFLEP